MVSLTATAYWKCQTCSLLIDKSVWMYLRSFALHEERWIIQHTTTRTKKHIWALAEEKAESDKNKDKKYITMMLHPNFSIYLFIRNKWLNNWTIYSKKMIPLNLFYSICSIIYFSQNPHTCYCHFYICLNYIYIYFIIQNSVIKL